MCEDRTASGNAYGIVRVGFFNPGYILRIADILYLCGKDMAEKYGLHHWDNSKFKTLLIVGLGLVKNRVYAVNDKNGTTVATFRTKRSGDSLHFGKLATRPDMSGRGIGSFCIGEIERFAVESGCRQVSMEVCSSSGNALGFYLNRGYTVSGDGKTLKYPVKKLSKRLL